MVTEVSAAKILIVDDEPGIRYFISETLSYNGYQITSTANGEDALELVESEQFDVAVLDLKMGKVGGLDILAALHQKSPTTAAIVLTGHGSMETAIEALRKGAHDYLLKPCDPQQLRGSVQESLKWRQKVLRQQRTEKYVSDVSHELRNPLTSISINLSMMDYTSPDSWNDYLESLKQAAAQMEFLINDTLTLSRLEANTTGESSTANTRPFTPTDLNILTHQIVTLYQQQANKADLELHFEPEPNLPKVPVVSAQINQVITNLLSNAINYTQSGGIHIRTYMDTDQEWVCIEVQDAGLGIAAEDLPRLFERFYRGKTAVGLNIPGNGLGLAIVKEIVESHHGTIDVESQPQQGTRFRVWLPVDHHNETKKDTYEQ
jgi:signal transduction histidine kinase